MKSLITTVDRLQKALSTMQDGSVVIPDQAPIEVVHQITATTSFIPSKLNQGGCAISPNAELDIL